MIADYLTRTGRTQAEFALAIGVTQSMVGQWVGKRRPIAAIKCPVIERETAGELTCEQLRPDLQWIRVNGKVEYYRVPVAA